MPDLTGHSIDHYEITASRGTDGKVVIYSAFDTRQKCDVIIRMICKESVLAAHWNRINSHFENEIKSIAKLIHPNIAKISDFGRYEDDLYLVSPSIPKVTLEERSGKLMSYKQAARLLAPVARALEYAHHQDIIHCDVKPANIAITEESTLMLSNFGMAKILDFNDANALVGISAGIGTPRYMAPEQWFNQVSPQTDIYSLGVVFYELVTGRVPYNDDTPVGMMLKQNTELLPNPRQFVPDLPLEVERVILKALARRPQDRFADMGAFAHVLEIFGQTKNNPKSVSSLSQRNEGLEKKTEPVAQIKNSEKVAEFQPSHDKPAIPRPSLKSPQPPSLQPLNQSRNTHRTTLQLISMLGVFVIGVLGIIILIGAVNGFPTKQNLVINDMVVGTLVARAQATLVAMPTSIPKSGDLRISEKDGMEQVYVPAGDFLMGSTQEEVDAVWMECGGECEKSLFDAEVPQHKVNLDAYWIDRSEVTNAMFEHFMSETGYVTDAEKGGTGVIYNKQNDSWENASGANWRNPNGSDTNIDGKEGHPVVQMSWNDARSYCEWAGGHLPSEAQWEKAARGTDGQMYPWGNGVPTSTLLNYNKNLKDTVAVGNYRMGASPYGALDMAGNVWEWVNDWYGQNYYQDSPDHNPVGPESGQYRVMRGGSWGNGAWPVRSALRDWIDPNLWSVTFGFRCVR